MDFFIVIISFVDYLVPADLTFIKIIRLLRILRPLRFISSMRLILDALS